jgi:predicted phage terminase large subunit-like protein
VPPYSRWCADVSPEFTWDWPHLDYIRGHLADVTLGLCPKLAISWPPQHAKTEGVTVRYPLWRMLRDPGIRVGVASYNQTFTNKQSRKTRKLARRLGLEFGEPDTVNEWSLANGSTFVARGAGAGIAGEPLNLLVIDDPFKNRQEADSPTIQERVYDWYMDDVTPRIQKGGSLIIIHTRWNAGDLIGRILKSEEKGDWRFVRLPAVAETQDERDRVHERLGLPTGAPDPLGRAPGEALCPDRFTKDNLESKRLALGVGFETLYQQDEVPRGGSFFQRDWFGDVGAAPEGTEWTRYWDLASSRNDAACFTSGVLMGKHGAKESARYFVGDVIRGRWMPAERNEVMLQTAKGDAQRKGFKRTWFEEPVFDKGGAAARAIVAKLAGYACVPDKVSGAGSKELRAEPLAGAAKAGLVKLVDGGAWKAAFLTEMEGFPRGQYKDQVDSSSGAFNKLSRESGYIIRDGTEKRG